MVSQLIFQQPWEVGTGNILLTKKMRSPNSEKTDEKCLLNMGSMPGTLHITCEAVMVSIVQKSELGPREVKRLIQG